MSETTDPEVPALIRQGELIEEISSLLSESVTGDWTKLVLNRRALSMFSEETMQVTRPDGSTTGTLGPRQASKLFKELRHVMYRPGAGTWLSLEWTVTNQGGQRRADVDFNYDDEPAWRRDIDPGLYGLDLDKFPRREDAIPDWLKAKLAEARARAK
ncbi:agglutinin cell wall attachment protein [Nocardioides sp. NPDC051685]|uniref:agglutinin cell wall attachment protein n=1 Tax=Nocardioides sp. NPDC051685 TaxID=3364334 RepID=UPI0037A66204